MIRLWIGLILSASVLVLAVLNARQGARAGAGGTFPGLHLAALGLSLVVAMLPVAPVSPVYKGVVLFALLVVWLREILFWIPGAPRATYAGPSFFVWFLLWLAFAATAGSNLWSLTGLLALIPVLILVFPVVALRSRYPGLWLTLSLYALQPALAVGCATVLIVLTPAVWSLLGLAGLLAFAVVDLLIALDLLRRPLARLPLWHQALTAVGTLLLALSIWGEGLMSVAQLFAF